MPDVIPDDEEVTLHTCPVCGKETIWFTCEDWDRGDGVWFESGFGPALNQACECRLTQRQVNSFNVMDYCTPDDDDWGI